MKSTGLLRNLDFVNTSNRPDPNYWLARKVDTPVYAKDGKDGKDSPLHCDWSKQSLINY